MGSIYFPAEIVQNEIIIKLKYVEVLSEIGKQIEKKLTLKDNLFYKTLI